MKFWNGLTNAARFAIAGVVAAVLLLGLLELRSCQIAKQHAPQARVDQGQAGAFHNSAADAVNTQGSVAANATASETLTRQNEEDIRHAQGADQTIDPAERDAGFASLCKRASFRNNPANRVRCSPPAVVAGASPHP